MISKAQARPNISLFLMSMERYVELATTPKGSCLHACHHAHYHGENGLNSSNWKQVSDKWFHLQEFPWSWCLTAVKDSDSTQTLSGSTPSCCVHPVEVHSSLPGTP